MNYLLLITKEDSTVLNKYIELARRNEINSYLRDYETSPELLDSTEVRLLHIPAQNHSITNWLKYFGGGKGIDVFSE